MVGTEHAPKPGDPTFKMLLGEPPGRTHGKEPMYKRVVPILLELAHEHPGEWACVAQFPPKEGMKHNPANGLMSSLKEKWPEADQYDFAARSIEGGGGYGLWAIFNQKALPAPDGD